MVNPLILLVEDNADDVALALLALKKNNIREEEVKIVKNGAEALDYLYGQGSYAGRDIEQQPKIILLDVFMPVMGGVQFLSTLRSGEIARDIPCVILTGVDSESDRVTLYNLGITSYIKKPMEFDDLVEVLSQISAYWLD